MRGYRESGNPAWGQPTHALDPRLPGNDTGGECPLPTPNRTFAFRAGSLFPPSPVDPLPPHARREAAPLPRRRRRDRPIGAAQHRVVGDMLRIGAAMRIPAGDRIVGAHAGSPTDLRLPNALVAAQPHRKSS